VTCYYTRSKLSQFLRHNWTNGVWAVLPFAYSDGMPVRWRHLAPLAFVAATLFLGWLVLAPYLLANLAASLHVAIRQRDWRYVALMPVTFAGLHFAYGAGSMWGMVRAVWTTRR
jgi:succinoglycan biosynthesis protein ExoA